MSKGLKHNVYKHSVCSILYILIFQIVYINSKTSTLWKLNADKTKIVEASDVQSITPEIVNTQFPVDDDSLFYIITSTELYGHSWIKQVNPFCYDCQGPVKKQYSKSTETVNQNFSSVSKEVTEDLSCGKPTNFTFYDNLVGVINRGKHPVISQPDAMLDFIKRFKLKNEKTIDMVTIEKRLKQIKKGKPKSVQLYNQLGNYWRLKGNLYKAIECFRKSLAISPHNSEVLLNLAKALFHLQYLDDAIYLTRRSLEVSPPEKGAWQQYFTLGEIFKAYGHYHEAAIHLRHSLELNSGYEPTLRLLKEMEEMPATTIHMYTMVIIICLVLGVLLVILSSFDKMTELDEDTNPKSHHRHFNKGLAVRSLRVLPLGSGPKRNRKISP